MVHLGEDGVVESLAEVRAEDLGADVTGQRSDFDVSVRQVAAPRGRAI
jgi:hypothetical protein